MSADPAVLKVVQSVVKELVDDAEMFTAHMVTKAVRDKGHFLKHDEGKDAVHDLYARGEFGIAYTRTQINVGQGWPWLYHKTSDDPAAFSGVYGGGQPQVKQSPVSTLVTNQNGSSTTIQIPANLSSAVSSDDDDGDDDGDSSQVASTQPLSGLTMAAPASMMTQNGGSNGRASIGSQVNLKNGRKVDARRTLSIPACLVRDHLQMSPGDKVYVVAGAKQLEICKSTSTPLKSYTVDCNSQVRITQATLAKAGLGGDSYDVDEQGDKIIVKLAR